jgi:hypothetical protein
MGGRRCSVLERESLDRFSFSCLCLSFRTNTLQTSTSLLWPHPLTLCSPSSAQPPSFASTSSPRRKGSSATSTPKWKHSMQVDPSR